MKGKKQAGVRADLPRKQKSSEGELEHLKEAYSDIDSKKIANGVFHG